ncbi:hypothetical protein ACOSQ2_024279 [Xanthoceras sorbifolium]
MKSRGNKSREDKNGPGSNSVGVPGADGLEKQIIPTAGSGKGFSEGSDSGPLGGSEVSQVGPVMKENVSVLRGKQGAENSVTTKVLEGNQKNMDADMKGLEEAHQLAFNPEEGVVTGQITVGELGCEGQVYAEPKSSPIKTTGRKWKRAARKGPNSNVLSGLPSPIQRILSARKIAKGRGRHGSVSPAKRSPTS